MTSSKSASPKPTSTKPVVPPMTAKTVAQQVDQDLKCCEALLVLLEDEREALKQRDAEKLDQIIDNKTEHLGTLERSSHIRALWIQKYHQANTEADSPEAVWQQSLTNLDPNLKNRWDTLKTLIKRCQDENEVNGRALSRNQQTFGKLLNIMRGQVSNGVTYTSSGGQNGNISSSSIGEA